MNSFFKRCPFKSLWTTLLISILPTVAARFKLLFYVFCNHFCWTDATSSACPWSLEECLRVSPSAETLICTCVGTFRMAATFTQCWDIDHSSASFVWLPLHLLVPQEHGRISTVQYKGKTWILSCVSTKSFTIFVTIAMAFWPKSQVY